MIYEYECDTCNIKFDVVKSVDLYNRTEHCTCGKEARKLFNTSRPIVDRTQPEYYPSLGQVVKSKAHKKEIMARKGLVEVGNEKPSTIHKEMKKNLDHKIKRRWEEADI